MSLKIVRSGLSSDGKKKQYNGAPWVKVPVVFLKQMRLNDRQRILYEDLLENSVHGEEWYRGEVLPRGRTVLTTREYARFKRVSDITIRRDLRALHAAGVIKHKGRQGKSVVVDIVPPKFLPAIWALKQREMSQLDSGYVREVIDGLLGITRGECRCLSQSESQLADGKLKQIQGLISELTHSDVALPERIEEEHRKPVLEGKTLTRGVNSQPVGCQPLADAIASGELASLVKKAALVAPQPSKIKIGELARERKFSAKVEIGDLPRDEAARNSLLSRVVLKSLKEGLQCVDDTFLEVQEAIDALIARTGIDSAIEKIDDFFNQELRLIINKRSCSGGVLNTHVADINKVNFSSLNKTEFSVEVDS